MSIDSGRRTFWTDWWRKLFALIFALIAFTLINGKIAKDHTIENVKVEFQITDTNIVTVLDDNIVAKLVVNTTLPLSSLKADLYRVVVVLHPRKEDHKYRIKVDVGPQNVTKGLFLPSVKSVTLSRDYVELDPIVKKSVPIVVPETGVTRPGFTAAKTLSPETVIVEGPSEKLKNVKFVRSEGLALTPDISDFTCRLQLNPDNKDSEIKLGESEVEVVVKIVNDKELIKVVHADVPIRIFNGFPQAYVVDKQPVKHGRIEVRALKSIHDTYKNSVPMLFIDLNEAKSAGVFHARVHAGNLPPKDKAEITYSPDYVDITLLDVQKAKPSALEIEKDAADGGVQAVEKSVEE